MQLIHLLILICSIKSFFVFAVQPLIPLRICTVASHHMPEFSQLLESCQRQGLDIDVLGMNKPYKGNGQKITYMKKYLATLPDEQILLFVDAFDVLILANEEEILRLFLNKKAPFVIAAEKHCCPAEYEEFSLPSPTPFRFINSGTYIGYVGFIKKLFNSISDYDESGSDQRQFQKYHKEELQKANTPFHFDYYCELFLPLHGVSEKEIFINPHSGRVVNWSTLSEPCIIHGNGEGKKLYQKVYDTLFFF